MSDFTFPLCAFFAGLFLIVGKEESMVSVQGELDRARTICINWISKLPRGSMIVFDFDDTLFDPNIVIGHVHAGGREFAHGDRKALPLYRPITQICDVLRYAVASGMYITVITARPDTNITKNVIIANFKHYKMRFHEFHANAAYPEHNNFKAILRRKISLVRPIGLTIGDNWLDVNESTNYHYVKLPDRNDPKMHSSLLE